jgi:protein-glutamine gamma-glutamyltransferase
MNIFSLLTYVLITLGLVSLLLAEIVSWPVFLLVALLVAVSPMRERWGLKYSKNTINVIVLGIIVYLLWRIFFTGADYLAQLLTFSLVLLAAKLYSPKAYRDHIQIFVICTFYLIAATLKLATLAYLGLFLVYLFLGIGYLILLNARRDFYWSRQGARVFEEGPEEKDFSLPPEIRQQVNRYFFLRLCSYFLFALLSSAAIFYLIPRFTIGYLGQQSDMVEISSGFAEDVQLGDLGQILLDDRPVMKVYIEGKSPVGRVGIRWRGITLDRFDGASWKVSPEMMQNSQFWFSRRQERPYLQVVNDPQFLEPNCTEHIELEPLNTRMVFHRPEVMAIEMVPFKNRRSLRNPDIHSIRLIQPADNYYFSNMDLLQYNERMRYFNQRQDRNQDGNQPFHLWLDRIESSYNQPISYKVYSHIAPPPEQALRNETGSDPPWIENYYLQLPAEGMDRYETLAREVTAGANNRYDQAEQVELWFRRQFTYTLSPPAESEGMSLGEFLFDYRRGHCEYFSAAMGVMLRTLGIPARVVNGFASGEYNRFGGYYQIRQKDAHSWIEVYFPSQGWVPFDPTPPQTEELLNPLKYIRQAFSVVESTWIKYVVDYDFRQQRRLFGGAFGFLRPRGPGRLPGLNLPNISSSPAGQKYTAIGAGVLLILVGGGLILASVLQLRLGRRAGSAARRTRPKTPDEKAAVDFYRAMQKILARKGFQRLPGQTPREFARSVSEKIPGFQTRVELVTDTYYAVRFGRQDLSGTLRDQVRQSLHEIKKVKI